MPSATTRFFHHLRSSPRPYPQLFSPHWWSAADLPTLVVAQQQDVDLLKFFNLYTGTKLKLGFVRLPYLVQQLVYEMSQSAPFPLTPEALRRQVTTNLHNLEL